VKITLLGTRGIPNRYGGFEQFAEELSTRLADRGNRVLVYTPAGHPFSEPSYKGVQLIRVGEPLRWLGALHSLFYDFRCLKRAFKLQPDIILLCGYGSAGLLRFLKNPSHIPVLIHLDGMEWKRKKWHFVARIFLHWSEKQATQLAENMIVDSNEVQKYYYRKYGKKPAYISYGAEVPDRTDGNWPDRRNLQDLTAGQYYLAVARMEPENNLELIIRGYLDSGVKERLVLVGDLKTKFGKKLLKKYKDRPGISFLGAIYDKKFLNGLRAHCKAYFHGHSVGGTNPSLLEAMASSCFIMAHDNKYNREVLKENALFFSTADEVGKQLRNFESLFSTGTGFAGNNLIRIEKQYNWEKITGAYLELFNEILRPE